MSDTSPKDYGRLRIKALGMLANGETVRGTAKKLGIGKTTVFRWKKEYETKVTNPVNPVVDEASAVAKAEYMATKIKVSDRYSKYVDNLRGVKDRQGKWAGAISETGIRTLKFANKFLAIVEKKNELSKQDMELIKLIPALLNSSASAVKSAGEAEDRAYSLELILQKLNELPNQIQKVNPRTDP